MEGIDIFSTFLLNLIFILNIFNKEGKVQHFLHASCNLFYNAMPDMGQHTD